MDLQNIALWTLKDTIVWYDVRERSMAVTKAIFLF